MDAAAEPPPNTESPEELRPKQSTFVVPRALPWVILLGVGCGIGGAICYVSDVPGPMGAVVAGVVFLLGSALAIQAARVAYRKERYLLGTTHLVAHRGGLVSDASTELDVRNITHVKLRLPWLRYKFFRVGDVIVESAGSQASEIRMRVVREPEQLYERIQELMRTNGFSLGKQQLLHQERPDLVGSIVECAGLAAAAVFAIVLTMAELLAEMASKGDISLAALVVGTPVLVIGPFALIVHFLDLRRRTYQVFDDAVVYTEGFLTRDNAFVPAENLADANTKRTLLDQILGLYDVQVSCQGTGQEIKFRRLRRGPALSDAIDRLVGRDLAPAAPAGAAEDPGAPAEGASLDVAPVARARQAKRVPVEEAWTAELRMHAARAVLPYLIACVGLPFLIPVWILALIQAAIRASVTRFSVRPSSVKSSYKFLSTREREFTYDKITGLLVKENPFDRWMGTVTVELWSIGAGEPLAIQHVKRSSLNLPALLRQVGVPQAEEAPRAEFPALFSVGASLRAHVPAVVLGGIAALALAVLSVVASPYVALGFLPLGIGLAIGIAYARVLAARQRLHLYEEHVEAQLGVLFRQHAYARHENVKKVVQTRYPGGREGNIQFQVAGERRIQQQKQGGGNLILALAGGQAAQGKNAPTMPYGFTAHYIALEDTDQRIDALLQYRDPGPEPMSAPEPVLSEGPALGNSLVGLIGLSLLILPLVVLLPISIPLMVLVVRRRNYRIEADRVVATSGVLYRQHASVLFSRIDSLQREQGMLGKMFKNGKVTILTAGSSKPDLVLNNLPSYEAFYAEVRKHYGKQADAG